MTQESVKRSHSIAQKPCTISKWGRTRTYCAKLWSLVVFNMFSRFFNSVLRVTKMVLWSRKWHKLGDHSRGERGCFTCQRNKMDYSTDRSSDDQYFLFLKTRAYHTALTASLFLFGFSIPVLVCVQDQAYQASHTHWKTLPGFFSSLRAEQLKLLSDSLGLFSISYLDLLIILFVLLRTINLWLWRKSGRDLEVMKLHQGNRN